MDLARKQLADLERSAAKAAATARTRTPPASGSLVEARELRQQGRTEEAIARYRAAINPGGNSAEAQAELGALLVSVRRPGDAVEVLRGAVRLAPAAPATWYNLAFALRETGQTEEAVKAYWRYITFKPKDPDPHYGLGRALESLGRDSEALNAFRWYLALETRPTERQWMKKARAEIARIEGPPGARHAPASDARTTAAPGPTAVAHPTPRSRSSTPSQSPLQPPPPPSPSSPLSPSPWPAPTQPPPAPTTPRSTTPAEASAPRQP